MLGEPGQVLRAAVLGSPIAHSLSPVLHRAGYAAAGLTPGAYRAEAVLGTCVTAWGMARFAAARRVGTCSLGTSCGR